MPLDERLNRPAVVEAERPARTFSNRAVLKAVTLAFLLANLLFALRLGPVAALILIGGCVGVWGLAATSPKGAGVLDAPLKPGRLAVCLLIALVLFVLGGEAHLLFANSDWLVRDAVLADLARTWSIPAYLQDGVRYLLRAPLGYYMAPSVVGRILGLPFAPVALLVQDTLILGGVLYLMRTASSGWRTIGTVLLWGSFAGGVSRLLTPLLLQPQPLSNVLATPELPLDHWHPYGEYDSSITQLFWAPNHALPGWWLAVLLILYAEAEVDLAVVAGSVGALTLWSPLAILPAIPSVFARPRLKAWFGEARSWMGLAAALAFLPVAAYLVISAGSIDHSSIILTHGEFFILYALFVVLELPAAIFVACNIKRLRRPLRALFWISFAVLLVLPCSSFGPDNDLVMRGSIASLTIVAFCMGEILFGPNRPRLIGTTIGVLFIAIGAICGLGEIDRALVTPSYPVSDCTLMQAFKTLSPGAPPVHYVVRPQSVPGWLAPSPRTWPGQAPARACWPKFPLPIQLVPTRVRQANASGSAPGSTARPSPAQNPR
jgi:hypothetical protein